MQCPKCNAAMQPDSDSRLTGAAGDVRIAITGVPTELCPSCGTRQLPDTMFVLRLLKDFASNRELRHASPKGIFHRVWTCCHCKAELKDTPQPHTFTVTQPLDSGASVRIEITAPAHNCWGCGTQQIALEGSEARHLAEAFSNALQSSQQPARSSAEAHSS